MSLTVRMRSSSGGSLSTGVVWDCYTGNCVGCLQAAGTGELDHFSSPTETRMCGLADCCKPLCFTGRTYFRPCNVNMHGFGWKFLAPSSSCARNSAMKIAERSSLKILSNPNTIISHTWPRHSTWSSTGPAPSVSKMEASKFPPPQSGSCTSFQLGPLSDLR